MLNYFVGVRRMFSGFVICIVCAAILFLFDLLFIVVLITFWCGHFVVMVWTWLIVCLDCGFVILCCLLLYVLDAFTL